MEMETSRSNHELVWSCTFLSPSASYNVTFCLALMFSFAKRLVEKLEGSVESPQSDPYFHSLLSINNNGHGLRVLSVTPHSTAQLLGFEAYFDYIVRINGNELPMLHPKGNHGSYSVSDDGSIRYGGVADEQSMVDYKALSEELARSVSSRNGSAIFEVWSSKGGILRQVSVPLEKFDTDVGEDVAGVEKLYKDVFKPLGMIVQSNHLRTATYVWRILNTHKDSPAFQAQMIPYSDYVIGCDSSFPSDENGKGLLTKGGEALFSNTILAYYNHHLAILREDNIPITLYVYNHDYDILRPVTVNLSKSWCAGQNRGILGCDVGYGLLHRIPEVVGKFDASADLVDDTLFENKETFTYNLQPGNEPVPTTPSATLPESKNEPSTNPVSSSPLTVFTPATAIGASPVAAPPKPALGSSLSELVAPPPAKSAKKKRHHVPIAMNGLADFMNDELSKSKAKDVLNSVGTNLQAAAAPPPPIRNK